MSSWAGGYGDFVLKPDLDTLRAGAVAAGHRDAAWPTSSGRTARRRRRRRRGRSCAAQLDRLDERGWQAFAGTELEFIIFRDTYEEAWHKGFRDLDPANLYNVDYSLLGTARVEPLLRRIRNEMGAAGMRVEDSKGECNFGQHEVNFHFGPALTDGRRARHLQERRQGDRRPGGHGDHVHGQVRRARGQLVPHPLLAARRATTRRSSPTTTRCSRASSPASSRACAS